MTIYIDENMSPHLARGFDIIQKPLSVKENYSIEVKSIKDAFGSGARDEDWIPLVGKDKACVITQDYNIKRIRHQGDLCEKYGIGMYYFRPPSKKGFLYWDMVKLVVKHWSDISKTASKQARPFAYKISSTGKMQKL